MAFLNWVVTKIFVCGTPFIELPNSNNYYNDSNNLS